MPHTISCLVLSIVLYFILLSPPVQAHTHYALRKSSKNANPTALCIFPADVEHNFTFAFSTILFGHHICAVRTRNIYIGKSNTTINVQALSSKKKQQPRKAHVKFNLHLSDFYCSSKCNHEQFICIFSLFHLSFSRAPLLLSCARSVQVFNCLWFEWSSESMFRTHLRFVVWIATNERALMSIFHRNKTTQGKQIKIKQQKYAVNSMILIAFPYPHQCSLSFSLSIARKDVWIIRYEIHFENTIVNKIMEKKLMTAKF